MFPLVVTRPVEEGGSGELQRNWGYGRSREWRHERLLLPSFPGRSSYAVSFFMQTVLDLVVTCKRNLFTNRVLHLHSALTI